MKRKLRNVVLVMLILFSLIIPVVESVDVFAANGVYIESLFGGPRHIGYKILDPETGVVCFVIENLEMKCLKYK